MRCRSDWASAGVNTARGRSCNSVRRFSSVSLWLPSKTILLTIGFSRTRTTSVLPSRVRLTSENRPVAYRLFRLRSIVSGSNDEPGWTSMYERIVPSSIRWLPTTLIAEITPPDWLEDDGSEFGVRDGAADLRGAWDIAGPTVKTKAPTDTATIAA